MNDQAIKIKISAHTYKCVGCAGSYDVTQETHCHNDYGNVFFIESIQWSHHSHWYLLVR